MLALQGISWFLRKGISAASISLDVNQYEAPPKPPHESTEIFTHIDIEQVAAGLSGTHEKRTLDDFWRPHSDWLFGSVKGRSSWVSLDEIEDEFLKSGWLTEGDGKCFVKSYVESQDSDWVATQIWGFQTVGGVRRYVRNIVLTKGKERAQVRLAYDFVS